MTPAIGTGLALFALGVLAGCIVMWGFGPITELADEQLADDWMDLADAVSEDEPVPFLPAEHAAPVELSTTDRVWLHRMGVQP